MREPAVALDPGDERRAALWDAVDRLVERAPRQSDLYNHRLEFFGARLLRRTGKPVPGALAMDERRSAALRALRAGSPCPRARCHRRTAASLQGAGGRCSLPGSCAAHVPRRRSDHSERGGRSAIAPRRGLRGGGRPGSVPGHSPSSTAEVARAATGRRASFASEMGRATDAPRRSVVIRRLAPGSCGSGRSAGPFACAARGAARCSFLVARAAEDPARHGRRCRAGGGSLP